MISVDFPLFSVVVFSFCRSKKGKREEERGKQGRMEEDLTDCLTHTAVHPSTANQ